MWRRGRLCSAAKGKGHWPPQSAISTTLSPAHPFLWVQPTQATRGSLRGADLIRLHPIIMYRLYMAFSTSCSCKELLRPPYPSGRGRKPQRQAAQGPHHRFTPVPDPKRTTSLTLTLTSMQGWRLASSLHPLGLVRLTVSSSGGCPNHGVILFHCLQGPLAALGRTYAWWREGESLLMRGSPLEKSQLDK